VYWVEVKTVVASDKIGLGGPDLKVIVSFHQKIWMVGDQKNGGDGTTEYDKRWRSSPLLRNASNQRGARQRRVVRHPENFRGLFICVRNEESRVWELTEEGCSNL